MIGSGVARRSSGQFPDRNSSVYLADTLGEMGLWYRLAPIAYVGGSFHGIGGHNPFEPIALETAVIHGPDVANFADIYRALDEEEAAIPVLSAEDLGKAVLNSARSRPSTAADRTCAVCDLARHRRARNGGRGCALPPASGTAGERSARRPCPVTVK